MQRFSKALTPPAAIGRRPAGHRAAHGRSKDTTTTPSARSPSARWKPAPATPPPHRRPVHRGRRRLPQIHEYELSADLPRTRQAAGAPDSAVRIGMANNYLAARRDHARRRRARRRQSHRRRRAGLPVPARPGRRLSARSTTAPRPMPPSPRPPAQAGEDQTAEQGLLAGRRRTKASASIQQLSVLSNLIVQPIFEDSTVYVLDSKLDSHQRPCAITNTGLLPPPRSSLQTSWTAAFHLHSDTCPPTAASFRCATPAAPSPCPRPTPSSTATPPTTRSTSASTPPSTSAKTSSPSTAESRAPSAATPHPRRAQPESLPRIHLRHHQLLLQRALSRWLHYRGVGPFTDSDQQSGRSPPPSTSASALPGEKPLSSPDGVTTIRNLTRPERRRAELLHLLLYRSQTPLRNAHQRRAIVEDLRAWRVVPFSPLGRAISQAIAPPPRSTLSLPAVGHPGLHLLREHPRLPRLRQHPERHLSLYARPAQPHFQRHSGKVHLRYPIRMSAGLRQETFLNFTQRPTQQFRPYFSITLF